MASSGSELDKMLAKRRSRSEEVFESSVAPSQAHASGVACAKVAEDPPWLAALQKQGVTFSAPADNQKSDELPHWLEAAAECGVTFYDPDGNEVVVPSSKVGAFKAGLESVRDFEHSMSPTADVALKPCSSDEAAQKAPTEVQSATTEVEHHRAASVDDGRRCAGPPDALDEEMHRQHVKNAVQKRYFALLRAGVDPNEAAVQAIIEAKGLGSQREAGAKDAAGTFGVVADGIAGGSSRGNVSRCRDAGQEECNKEVAVTA